MKYDFILFENSYRYENHYKDIVVMGVMLQKMGYSVAIADVFKEKELSRSETIPHIELSISPLKKFSKVTRDHMHMSSLQYSLYRWIQNIYLIYVLFVLRNKARNFYLGSLTMDTPIMWLFFLTGKHNYFLWGLRSYTLISWREKNRGGRFSFYSRALYHIVRRNKRIKLIVSNEIIKDEFVREVGIITDRLVLRPERWITSDTELMPLKYNSSSTFTLMTIGTLRRNKHVEFVIDALRQLNDDGISYVIAGKCRNNDGYDEMIMERSKGMDSVKRLNYYVSDDEYKELFRQCDFLVLCDKPQKTCGSNGTMLDAIIMGCPIIAPNYEPFSSEIMRYSIGVCYEYGNIRSLAEAIMLAKDKGKLSFASSIDAYRDRLKEGEVMRSLQSAIAKALIE